MVCNRIQKVQRYFALEFLNMGGCAFHPLVLGAISECHNIACCVCHNVYICIIYLYLVEVKKKALKRALFGVFRPHHNVAAKTQTHDLSTHHK